MKNKVISVIVAIYNIEAYLEKCIDSIVNQSYSKLEIILVNDGSTDSSGAICQSYAEKDSRIKVINKPNGGLSSARNTGLDCASGDYIAFVDGDDFLDQDMYEQMLKKLDEHQADIVECSYREIYEDCVKETTAGLGDVLICNNYEALTWQLKWKYFLSVAWNKIYVRELWKDIRFPIGKYHEDEFITYQVFYKAKKLVFYDIVKYNYIKYRNSSITAGFTKKNIDKLEALQEKERFFIQASASSDFSKLLKIAYYWVLFDTIIKAERNEIQDDRINEEIRRIKSNWKKEILKDYGWGLKIQLTLLCICPKIFYIIRKVLNKQ